VATSPDGDGTNLTNIKQITGGGYHTCALSNTGKVYCWGSDFYGELGNGSDETGSQAPTLVEDGVAASPDGDGTNLTNIKQIMGGIYHTCALSNTGKVYCWGNDDDGQLGNGSDETGNQVAPTLVEDGVAASPDTDGTNLTNIKQITGGYYHTCALSNTGKVYCWGNDTDGQLGNGSDEPTLVEDGVAAGSDSDGTNLTNIKQITGGIYHTCALSNTGKVYCWGWDDNGELGNGSDETGSQVAPTLVEDGVAASPDTDGTNLTNIKQITGGIYHTCALSNTGKVYCWGWDDNGQLGNGSDETGDQVAPTLVEDGVATSPDGDGTNLTNIKQITGGSYHTCALSNTGKVYCWGWDFYGQLGNGSDETGDQVAPTLVEDGVATSPDTDGTNLTNIKQITGGYYHTCALSNTGKVYCWGWDFYGQLGNGSDETGDQVAPTLVEDGVAAGSDSDGTNLTNIKRLG